MKIFKKLIPQFDHTELVSVESFTVQWKVRANGYEQYNTFHQVFLSLENAKESKIALEEAAKFLKVYIDVEIIKNK